MGEDLWRGLYLWRGGSLGVEEVGYGGGEEVRWHGGEVVGDEFWRAGFEGLDGLGG